MQVKLDIQCSTFYIEVCNNIVYILRKYKTPFDVKQWIEGKKRKEARAPAVVL